MISEMQKGKIASILSVYQTLPSAERQRIHEKLKARLRQRRAGQKTSIDQEARS